MNNGSRAVTITRLDVVIAKGGSVLSSCSIGPSAATSVVQPNGQVVWGPIDVTHVPAQGDLMTLTVTYLGGSGAQQQVTKSTAVGS